MGSVVISGDTSGSVTLQAPATAGTTSLTLPVYNGTVAITSGLTSGRVSYATTNGILTDSSNLTFDGTKVGIGTTSPATRLQIGNYGSTEELTLAMSANAEGRINFYDTNNTEGAVIRVVGGGAGAKMHFTNRYDTDSDKVTFDLVNGRVGIGTTSPSENLDIQSSGDLKARIYTTGSTVSTHAGLTLKTGSYEYIIQNLTTTAGSAGALRFYDITAGAERMRIDSSGNVGIGVTPNSWTSGWTALQFGSYGNLSALSNQINLSSNIYYSGSSWYYKNTNPATNFYQQNGGFGWQSAASGTAGTSPSLTTYMWLSAAGYLGVGTSSPNYRLSVYGASGDLFNLQSSTTMGTDGQAIGINFSQNGNVQVAGIQALTTSSSNIALTFGTYSSGYSEKMRITSAGEMFFGATSAINADKVGITFSGTTHNGLVLKTTRSAAGSVYALFVNSVGGTAGQISQNDTNTISMSGVARITFPATQSASTDGNTLDDYEEGTWTPTFKASGGTAPSTQTGTGYYVKIGRMVHVHGQISWSGSGSGGANLYVDLPFTVLSTGRGGFAIGLLSGLTWLDGSQLSLLPEINSSVAYFTYKVPSGAAHVHLTYSAIADIGSHLVTFGGSYSTND